MSETKKTDDLPEEVAKVIKNSKLTDQEQLFCLVYVKCFNPRKAYQRAFDMPSSKDAERLGRNLLNRKDIQAQIKELKKMRFTKVFVDEEDVLQKHIDIAFADITDIVEFGYSGSEANPNMVRLKDSANVDGTVVAEIRFSKTTTDIRMVDKQKSLDWLSTHYGQMDAEKKAKLEKLRAETAALAGRDQTDGGIVLIPAVLPTGGKANGKPKAVK